MQFTSFSDVEHELARYMSLTDDFGHAYKLDRIKALLENLGNPQNQFKSVHIAGTSGKTSTSYYAAGLLAQAGKKVGLTVSPHVECINERLQINQTPLPESRYCELFTEFYALVQGQREKPTYFELLIAFAYWAFAHEGVDYAVVEVGLGGLLDSTNVITRADKVCIITDIGYDHTHLLGKTLSEISAQKAGIIRPHNHVFIYEQSADVMQVVREVSSQQQAVLHEVMPLHAKELPKNLPLFQRRNWYLALQACQYIFGRDGIAALNEPQLFASTERVVPGRMEEYAIGNKLFVLDGAHNAQKIQAFVASYRAKFPRRRAAVLFALAQHKGDSLRAILDLVTPIANHMIITTFAAHNTDMRRRAVHPNKIAEQLHIMGYERWEITSDSLQAFEKLKQRDEDTLLVIGSFYLLGTIRPLLHGPGA